MWFLITGASVNELPDSDWELMRNGFVNVAHESAPVLAGTLATMALSVITPRLARRRRHGWARCQPRSCFYWEIFRRWGIGHLNLSNESPSKLRGISGEGIYQ